MQMLVAGVVSSVDVGVGLGVGAGARIGAGVVVGAGAGACAGEMLRITYWPGMCSSSPHGCQGRISHSSSTGIRRMEYCCI